MFGIKYRVQYLLILVCLLFSSLTVFAQTVGGIGARLALDSSAGYTMPRIQGLVAGSPAAAVLKDSLYIIKVAGTDCKNKNLEEVVAIIRGEVGTTVKITVADNTAGKRAKDYDLVRAAIALPASNMVPDKDPLIGFYDQCESDAKAMRRKGKTIIKTYTSDCGNYFFNFDADASVYHVRLVSLAQKSAGDLTARIFDGNNENVFTALLNPETKALGDLVITTREGEMTFNRDCVGVVNTQYSGDAAKCRGMFILIYK
jgi:hypothetical protein